MSKKEYANAPTAEQFSIKRELRRKSIHLGMIIAPVWVYFTPDTVGLLGLIIATSVTVVVDLLRLSDHRFRKFFLFFFQSMIRRHEEGHILGATYFMIAALLSVIAFDKQIAISALSFLVIGDTAAAIVGKKWGTAAYWGKSLHGSFACFAVSLAIGAFTLGDIRVAAFGAVAAAVAEALPVPMDDNMRVPIFSGLVMQLVTQYVQG
jgi:dolichol kinase